MSNYEALKQLHASGHPGPHTSMLLTPISDEKGRKNKSIQTVTKQQKKTSQQL